MFPLQKIIPRVIRETHRVCLLHLHESQFLMVCATYTGIRVPNSHFEICQSLLYKNPSVRSAEHLSDALRWILSRSPEYFNRVSPLTMKLDGYPVGIDLKR